MATAESLRARLDPYDVELTIRLHAACRSIRDTAGSLQKYAALSWDVASQGGKIEAPVDLDRRHD